MPRCVAYAPISLAVREMGKGCMPDEPGYFEDQEPDEAIEGLQQWLECFGASGCYAENDRARVESERALMVEERGHLMTAADWAAEDFAVGNE